MQISGVNGVIETLNSLPPELVSKRGGIVKLALAKGARLLRDEEKRILRAKIDTDDSTGLLLENIIASRGKALYGANKGERYLVRVKRKTYQGRKGKPVTTWQTAQFKEYGTSDQPADPFIRPAVLGAGERVINTITQDFLSRLDNVVKKLASQNKAR